MLASLTLVPPPLSAQAPEVDPLPAVRMLRFGQRMRLDIVRVGRVEGRFVVASDTSLTLTLRDLPTEVRLADVRRLWVRGRATATGGLIGAGAGLLAGVLYGLAIGSVACGGSDGGNCTPAEVAAVTGLLGGAGGAAVGGGIGFMIVTWRLRFP